MSRKTLYSLIAIGALLLYILLSIDYSRDETLSLPEWQGDADSITVARETSTLEFTRKGNGWVLGKEEFPADTRQVEAFQKKLQEMRFVDVVSSGDDDRYDVSDGVKVSVEKNGKVLRELIFGKKASTGNHVYVKEESTGKVYLVSGAPGQELNYEMNRFRNREVMNFKSDDVLSVTISGASGSFRFVPEPSEEKEDSQAPVQWKLQGSERPVDSSLIQGLVDQMSRLTAQDFPDESLRGEKTEWTFTVQLEGEEMSLMLHGTDPRDEKKLLATCSTSPYLFTLPLWQFEKYLIDSVADVKAK